MIAQTLNTERSVTVFISAGDGIYTVHLASSTVTVIRQVGAREGQRTVARFGAIGSLGSAEIDLRIWAPAERLTILAELELVLAEVLRQPLDDRPRTAIESLAGYTSHVKERQG